MKLVLKLHNRRRVVNDDDGNGNGNAYTYQSNLFFKLHSSTILKLFQDDAIQTYILSQQQQQQQQQNHWSIQHENQSNILFLPLKLTIYNKDHDVSPTRRIQIYGSYNGGGGVIPNQNHGTSFLFARARLLIRMRYNADLE